MQMSVFLALVQTFVGAATLGVALLALTRGNPPQDGGNSNSSEDQAPSPTGTSMRRPGPSGLNPVL